LITDGQRIYVPNKKEVETLSDAEIAEVVLSTPIGKEKNDESSNKTKVNINKAKFFSGDLKQRNEKIIFLENINCFDNKLLLNAKRK